MPSARVTWSAPMLTKMKYFLVQELERAIHCKYVAVDAVQALAQVYQQLMKMHPHDYQIPQRWAKILISAPLSRPEDGCDVLETAANSANIQGGADCSIYRRDVSH